ncbi:MAG: hypothetical protein EOP52_03160 [Sphingobacteriales bacterium]|nr:MAG: hypothetical protein EOP52_03160 [Sphingobacteriales bacterium]
MSDVIPFKKSWLILLLAAVWISPATAQLKKGTHILHAPKTGAYAIDHPVYEAENGYRGEDKWVALVSQDGTAAYTRPDGESRSKALSFMQPCYVIKKRGEYLKLIEYNPNLKFRKWIGTVANWQDLKSLGWVHQSKVLPWQVALRDPSNRFYIKYVTALHGKEIFKNPEQYFTGDSINVFSEPTVSAAVRTKLAAGSLLYAYKRSDDQKFYLVGTEPQCLPDSAAQIMLGWLPAQLVAPWGEKAYLQTTDATTGMFRIPVPGGTVVPVAIPDPVLNQYPYFTQTLFPLYNYQRKSDTTEVLTSTLLTNVLDHRDNKIFNMLGQPVTYARFRTLQRQARKLNIVLLVDGSGNNSNFTAPLMTVLQQMQLAVDSLPAFSRVQFGAFMYQGAGRQCLTETVMPLTSDYQRMAGFFERNIAQLGTCNNYGGGSVFEGIVDASRLLSGHEDESNIVIVIGGSERDMTGYEWSGVINSLTQTQSRLLVYQTHSDASPAYDNFIIDAKNLITQSADNIISLRKELVVESTPTTALYDFKINTGDYSVFSLDYPARSRWQGAVVFPNKYEPLTLQTLNQTLDTLISQMQQDNQQLLTAMSKVFEAYTGNLGTRIDARFEPFFEPYVAQFPQQAAKYFRKKLDVFSMPGTLHLSGPENNQPGLLLSKNELEQFTFHMSHLMAILDDEDYSAHQAGRKIRRYTRRYIRKNDLKKPMPYRAMTLADVHQVFTGMDADMLQLPAVRLKRYGRRSGLNAAGYRKVQDTMDRYYTSLKNYSNTEGAQQLNMRGQVYYWLPVRL